jgi:hypothetical protein
MKITTRSAIGGVAVGSIATLALALSPVPQAQAATITSLYNTGVDAAGTPLADGTIGDPHYTLISVPSGTTDIRTIQSSGGYPVAPVGGPIPEGYYLPSSSVSSWIGPNNDQYVQGRVGDYDFRTTFNLSGFDYSSANIALRWAADNQLKIVLNGTTVVTDFNGRNDDYNVWSSTVNISSGFISGINTLDFIVKNTAADPSPTAPGGPTALRAEFLSATADAAAVPEPSDLVGTAFAFGSMVLLKRKLTKKTLRP